MRIPRADVARFIVSALRVTGATAALNRWDEERHMEEGIRVLEENGWVVVDAKMTAAFTEALRQACRCSGAKDPAGVPVPHEHDCPMFPFERPGPNQSLVGFLSAGAAFEKLITSAFARDRAAG